jgi:molecular chaperone GrpE
MDGDRHEPETATGAAGGAPEPTGLEAPTEGLSPAELQELRKRAEERDAYRAELLRVRADFENYQKRARKERPALEDQAARRVLRDLLPVCDNLERALSHAPGASAADIEAGVRLTLQMLLQALVSHGVEEVPASDLPFDPQLHEAVAHVAAEGSAEGQVVHVMEKGYRHRDAVLRPAKVTVAARPAPAARHQGAAGDNDSAGPQGPGARS